MTQDLQNGNAENTDAANNLKGIASVLLEDGMYDCIYTLTEQDPQGVAIGPKVKNGEELILFYGRDIELLSQIGNKSRFKGHQETIKDIARYYSIDNLSTITSRREILVKLSCSGRFGNIGSDRDFEDIALEISENEADSGPDVCFVQHFNEVDHRKETCIFTLRLNSHWFAQIWASLAADKNAVLMFWVQDGSLHHEINYTPNFGQNIVKLLSKSQPLVLKGKSKPLNCGDGVAEFALRVCSENERLSDVDAGENASEDQKYTLRDDIKNELLDLHREVKSAHKVLQILCVVVGFLVGISLVN